MNQENLQKYRSESRNLHLLMVENYKKNLNQSNWYISMIDSYNHKTCKNKLKL